MGDQRNLTFGVQWDVDTAPLDEAKQRERELQEETRRTAATLDQIGVSMSGIGTRAGAAFRGVQGASTSMGMAVRSAMLDSIKQGDSLTKVIKSGLGAALDNAKAKAKGFGVGAKSVFSDIGQALRHPIQTIKATLGDALNKVGSNAQDAGKKAKGAGADFEDMGKRGGSSAESLGSKFASLIRTLAGLVIIKKGIDLIKEFTSAAIGAAANAEETQSKFETVFGGQTEGAQAWVDNFSAAAKRSKQEIKGFLADSQAMMKGLGMKEEAGAAMSKQMTSLAYDLASFHNLNDTDAFAKIRSGLMGETEGLKSMGIVMNEAAIQQAMLAAGYKGNESALRKQFDAMSESEKAQMRMNVIIAQSKDALTDVTRTSDSYTNSLKGVKGMWQDFLANAGAKFTPALTQMFNVILQAWPTIEPMLMQLVSLLADGMQQAIPILLQLGQTLLPVFTQALGILFQVAAPLIPVFMQLAQTILPPVAQIFGLLAQTLLPPLVSILNVLNTAILQPLMPVFTVIANAILPPIAQLLGIIAPILQALAPILQVIGTIIGVIAEVIGTIIGWVADGVGAVVDFFSSIFGGAKEASEETGKLADNMADVTAAQPSYTAPDISTIAMPEVPPIEIPPVTIDTSQAQVGMQGINTTSTDTYQSIATDSSNAWAQMGTDAKAGADGVILQFRRIKEAAAQIGGVNITATVTGAGADIPHYADGTGNHPGGYLYKDEEGGELAWLPGGSAVVPADQTEKLISRSNSRSLTFAPQVNITLPANATEADKHAIEERFRQIIREEYEEMRRREAEDEAIQEAIA